MLSSRLNRDLKTAHRFKVGASWWNTNLLARRLGCSQFFGTCLRSFRRRIGSIASRATGRALSGPCKNVILVRPSCQRLRTTRSSPCDAPAGITDDRLVSALLAPTRALLRDFLNCNLSLHRLRLSTRGRALLLAGQDGLRDCISGGSLDPGRCR